MKKILSGNSLKVLAVASMTVDHVGAVLFPSQIWMRCVGRLAFVIYAFLIAEGYFHTHNVKKYMGRLGFLAIVSEIPFDLIFHHTFVYWGSQNVFFTLFLGLVGLYLMDRIKMRLQPQFWFCALIPVAAMCLAAGLLQCDYRYYGILVITLFYMARDYRWAAFGGIAVIQVWMGWIQSFGIAALIPIALYNGKKGNGGKLLQWIFYFYYPVHLLIIYGIWRYAG